MVSRVGATTRTLSLDGDGWELLYSPKVDAVAIAFPSHDPTYRRIPAVVPGSVELDLMRAGLMNDPFVGGNLPEAWAIEYGDWWYRTEFSMPDDWSAADTSLLFDGLDTIATVYVNGMAVGATANMMIAHELPVATAVRPGKNELVVHLRSPLAAAEEYPYPAQTMQIWESVESLWIRKPPHMYGWDISPRLVSAGIFRGVRIVERQSERLLDWYMSVKQLDDATAILSVHYELSFAPRGRDVRIEITGCHAPTGKTFATTVHPTFTSGRAVITVDEPEQWMPRSHGTPELYDVDFSVTVDGASVDRHQTRWGLRRLGLDWKMSAGDDGRFRVHVNDEPVIVLGTNWVPLDAIHARDTERLAAALDLLDRSGCNAVRTWGGNLYEGEEFFDWCDENGILVWQDFAFACARYPQEEPFLSAVAEEAESVVRRLRNHPSLMLWCGSNETDDSFAEDDIDPWTDEITRSVLPNAVRSHGFDTPYIPSSPAHVPGSSNRSRDPEQHLWGARAWFKEDFYTNVGAQFVSEMGYHGMPALSSLERFVPALPPSAIVADPVWRLHETDHRAHPNWYYSRNQLLINQARLYLDNDDDDLAQLVLASQVSQAEAKKFFVEQTRLARGDRWGLMWWNLLDGWPQVSDAVVDYYFRPKLAFHYLARAQQPVCMMAAEATGWSRRVVMANDSVGESEIDWRIRSASTGGVIEEGNVRLAPRTDRTITSLPLAPRGDCYLFDWAARSEAGRVLGANHYTEGAAPLSFERYRDVYLPQLSALTPTFDAESSWR